MCSLHDLQVFTGTGWAGSVAKRQLSTRTGGEPMTIELNHTIVYVKDRWAASRDVGHVLGLPEATAYGPFAELKLDNAASLDFMDSEDDIHGQHYAFLVGRRTSTYPRSLARRSCAVVGRALQAPTARDQPPGRWPWALLGRP